MFDNRKQASNLNGGTNVASINFIGASFNETYFFSDTFNITLDFNAAKCIEIIN